MRIIILFVATVLSWTAFGQVIESRAVMLKGAGAPTANCTVGERYFRTDATAGQNLYLCTATNTWTQSSGSGTTVQVGGTPLPSQPVNTVNFAAGFGTLLAGSTSGGVSTVTVTAESGPFDVTTLPSAASNSGRAVIVRDCTSFSVLGAGGGTSACLVRSNGSSWVVQSGGGGSSFYSENRGPTSGVTPSVNTWTDVYSIADVPALAAGKCYNIDLAIGSTDATVNAYDTRIRFGTASTVVMNWAGGTEKYRLMTFAICNNEGSQTTQYISDKYSGYSLANNANTGLAAYFPLSNWSTATVNLSAPSTLNVQVQTATAAKTFRGFYLRISQ